MNPSLVVIGGGQNAEHDVGLASAAAVEGALRRLGHPVTSLTIGRDGRWHRTGREGCGPGDGPVARSLAAGLALIADADVVFPAVHGPLGEDGALAALCALGHIPIVGSGPRAGAIGMDKWTTKLVAEAVGLRTAPARLVRGADIDAVPFSGEAVVKPVSAGSSYGVALAEGPDELRRALHDAARYDDRILVERVVRGREVDVAVLREADGTVWSPPPLEVQARGLFDTATKYDGTARFTVPADLDTADVAALTRAATTLFDALGCAGVARVDFFLTADGPVLNEVNTMPGLTPASQVPRMFAAAGVAYDDLVARLVAAAG